MVELGQEPVSDEGLVVIFRLPPEISADRACVVGEFNRWSNTANPMRREGGSFTARIVLRPGKAYWFRYLLDGIRWENDWCADAYVPNEFGGDDSVLDLTNVTVASTEAVHAIDPEPAAPRQEAVWQSL